MANFGAWPLAMRQNSPMRIACASLLIFAYPDICTNIRGFPHCFRICRNRMAIPRRSHFSPKGASSFSISDALAPLETQVGSHWLTSQQRGQVSLKVSQCLTSASLVSFKCPLAASQLSLSCLSAVSASSHVFFKWSPYAQHILVLIFGFVYMKKSFAQATLNK